jgi:hypothetical protein
MTYATPNIKEVLDTLIGDELTDDAVVLGVFGGRRWRSVVDENGVHSGIEDPLTTHTLENTVDGSGVIVGESHIGCDLYNLAGNGMIQTSFFC